MTGRAAATLEWTAIDRLRVQIRVIRALLIREMMTRYGRRNIGFLWLVAEPLILTGGIIIVWSLTRNATHGVPIVAFALTGYSMLTLWRTVVQRGVGCLRDNAPLLFHQNVRMVDTIISRTLLETFGSLASFSITYLCLRLSEHVRPIEDYLLLTTAWALMALFSFGAALILAGLSEMWDGVERLVQPLMYLSLPLSGAFTMMAWLPDGARSVLLYSPLVHATEMFRAGFMGDGYAFHFSIAYLAASALAVVVIGLCVVHEAEKHIHHA